jgi:hypothetical protein
MKKKGHEERHLKEESNNEGRICKEEECKKLYCSMTLY